MPQLHKLYPYTRILRHNAARGSPTVGRCNCVTIIAYQNWRSDAEARGGGESRRHETHRPETVRDRKIGCGPGWMQRRKGKCFGHVCNTVLDRQARTVRYPLTSRANIGRSVHFRHALECSAPRANFFAVTRDATVPNRVAFTESLL